MKIFSIIVTAIIMAVTSCHAQGKFTINGKLQHADSQKIYLYLGDKDNDMEVDSAVISNGHFSFSGLLDVPFKNGTLFLGKPSIYKENISWRIAVEPQIITFQGDANCKDSVIIVGGQAQTALNALNKETSVILKPFMELEKEYYIQQTQAGKDSIRQLQTACRTKYAEYCKNYMFVHTDSYYATQYLFMNLGHLTYEEIKAIWNKLSLNVQEYGVNAKDVKAELETLAKVRPGKAAPDFTTKDVNGKPFTLSSLRGKVVIIDFWASWCIPCRKSNPHMRSLYAKYHDKGLDLVYVSDDDGRIDRWKKAIAQDQLTGDGYHHVLRGLKTIDKGIFDKTNDISDKYAIHYLPTKYLIDKKGNIVCKINEGEDAKLDDQIEKLLNE